MAEQIQKIQNYLNKNSSNRATYIRKKKYSEPGTLRYEMFKQAEVSASHSSSSSDATPNLESTKFDLFKLDFCLRIRMNKKCQYICSFFIIEAFWGEQIITNSKFRETKSGFIDTFL